MWNSRDGLTAGGLLPLAVASRLQARRAHDVKNKAGLMCSASSGLRDGGLRQSRTGRSGCACDGFEVACTSRHGEPWRYEKKATRAVAFFQVRLGRPRLSLRVLSPGVWTQIRCARCSRASSPWKSALLRVRPLRHCCVGLAERCSRALQGCLTPTLSRLRPPRSDEDSFVSRRAFLNGLLEGRNAGWASGPELADDAN